MKQIVFNDVPLEISESWYNPELILNKQQLQYIFMITKTFNMRNEAGNKVPYNPTKYQIEFHLNSINLLGKKAKDILFIKARGISFTFCSCIELIQTALYFNNQIIPIIAQRYDSAKEILNICKWLLRNANRPFEENNKIEIMETEINFLETNSSIKIFPSGSASNAIRGLRLIRCLPYSSEIVTSKGLLSIGEIVEKNIEVKVLTYNHEKKEFEWKRIKNRLKTSLDGRKMIKINKELVCTEDHPVFTNEGYKNAKDIEINQKIYKLKGYSYIKEYDKYKSSNRTAKANNSWFSDGRRRDNKQKGEEPVILLHMFDQKNRLFELEEENVGTIIYENLHTKDRLRRGSNSFIHESPPILHRDVKYVEKNREEETNERVSRLIRPIRNRCLVYGRRVNFSKRQGSFYINPFIWRRGTSFDKKMDERKVRNKSQHERGQTREGAIFALSGKRKSKVIQTDKGLRSSSYGIQDMEKRMQVLQKRIFPQRQYRILFDRMPKEIFRDNQKKSVFENEGKIHDEKKLCNMREGIPSNDLQKNSKKNNLRLERMYEKKRERNRQDTIPRKGLLEHVHKTTHKEKETFVYDLEIEGNHNFFANGFLVHNCLIDEFSYQTNDKELLTAVQDAMTGKLGQIIIGSTPCGRNSHFFKLVQNPIGFKLFRLPAFENEKLDLHKSILHQNLIPIAPWIDLEKLEIKRQRDIEIFRQEHCCDFLDNSLNFLPYNLIMRCINKDLVNYKKFIEKNIDFIHNTTNPIYMGIDVARNNDLTAIVMFEKIYDAERQKEVLVQRYLEVIKNMSLPNQEIHINNLIDKFPSIVKVRIDSTGLGLGLFEWLQKKHGKGKIEPIHFAERTATTDAGHSVMALERMSINLKNLMQDDCVNFLEDDLQITHLNDVDYNYHALRRPGIGHGDLFFANCLALLQDNWRRPNSSPIMTNVKPKIQKNLWEETLDEKMNRIKEQNKGVWI